MSTSWPQMPNDAELPVIFLDSHVARRPGPTSRVALASYVLPPTTSNQRCLASLVARFVRSETSRRVHVSDLLPKVDLARVRLAQPLGVSTQNMPEALDLATTRTVPFLNSEVGLNQPRPPARRSVLEQRICPVGKARYDRAVRPKAAPERAVYGEPLLRKTDRRRHYLGKR